MYTHCLSYSSRANHFHDLVKIFNLPNLFSQDFGEKKKNGKFYMAKPETLILLKLLSLHLTVMVYLCVLKFGTEITKWTDQKKNQGIKSVATRLKKYFNLDSNDGFDMFSSEIVCQNELELPFLVDKKSKKFIFVLRIAPQFWNIAPAHSIILNTAYFELTNEERAQFPNQQNVSNFDTPNFSSKQEALSRFFDFFNSCSIRFQLDELIEILVSQELENKKMDKEDYKKLLIFSAEKLFINNINDKIFNGVDIYHSSTLSEFLDNLNKINLQK